MHHRLRSAAHQHVILALRIARYHHVRNPTWAINLAILTDPFPGRPRSHSPIQFPTPDLVIHIEIIRTGAPIGRHDVWTEWPPLFTPRNCNVNGLAINGEITSELLSPKAIDSASNRFQSGSFSHGSNMKDRITRYFRYLHTKNMSSYFRYILKTWAFMKTLPNFSQLLFPFLGLSRKLVCSSFLLFSLLCHPAILKPSQNVSFFSGFWVSFGVIHLTMRLTNREI